MSHTDLALSAMVEPELVVDPFADVEQAADADEIAPTQLLDADQSGAQPVPAAAQDEDLAPTQVVEHVEEHAAEQQQSQVDAATAPAQTELYTADESSDEEEQMALSAADAPTDGVKKVYMDYDLLSSESDSDSEANEADEDAAAPTSTETKQKPAAVEPTAAHPSDSKAGASTVPSKVATGETPEADGEQELGVAEEDDEEALMRAADEVDEEGDDDDVEGAAAALDEEMDGFVRDSSGTDQSDSNDEESDNEAEGTTDNNDKSALATADEDEDADQSYGDDDGDIKSLLKRKPVVARQVVPAHIQAFIADIKLCVRQALGLQAKLAAKTSVPEPEPVRKLTHAELLQQKVSLKPKAATEATLTLDEDELMSLSDDDDEQDDDDDGDELLVDLVRRDSQLVPAQPKLSNGTAVTSASSGDSAQTVASTVAAGVTVDLTDADANSGTAVLTVATAEQTALLADVAEEEVIGAPATHVTAQIEVVEVAWPVTNDIEPAQEAPAVVGALPTIKAAVKRKTFDDLAEDHHLAKLQVTHASSDDEVDEEQQRREAERRSMKRHKFKHQKQIQRTKSQALTRTNSNTTSDNESGADKAVRSNSNEHLITRAVTSGVALLGATVRRTNTGLPLARHPSGLPSGAMPSPIGASSSALHSPAASVVASSSGLVPMISRLHSRVNSLLGRNNSSHAKADETSLQATRTASSAQATKAYVFKRADSNADASNKENVTASKESSAPPSSRTSSNTGKLSSEVAKQAFTRNGSSHMQHTPMLLAGSSGLQRTGAIAGGGRGNSLLMTALAKSSSIKRPAK